MSDSQIVIRPLGQAGDLGWVVMAHGEVYANEFGWDATFEGLVARIVADYAADHDPAREAGWIAEADGRRVGCVFCVAADHTTAQLRILLVHPSARGSHLGGRLVEEEPHHSFGVDLVGQVYELDLFSDVAVATTGATSS